MKKKKKKKNNGGLVIVLLFSMFLLLSLVAAIVLSNMRPKFVDAIWQRKINIKDEAVTNTMIWLSGIDNFDVQKEWVDSMADDMLLIESLEIQATDSIHGSYQIKLDKDAYHICLDKSNQLLSDCLDVILMERLQQSGYAESVTTEMVQELTNEILGCDLQFYLKEKQIQMIPTYEELESRFAGAGQYEISGEAITWRTGNEEQIDSYILNKDTFVLTNKSFVYNRYEQEER